VSSNKILIAVLCTMACSATCVAQIYTNYGTVTSSDTIAASPNWNGGNLWAVDVNNDGIPDLVQEEYNGEYGGAPPPQFAVSIANGDGTFQPPVGYNLPPALGTGAPIAFGDFNGDGKIDLAMWANCQTIAIYLGNGDGTFQNPWYSNIPIAQDQCIDSDVQFGVADFNHDGNVDLAISGSDQSSGTTAATVYILPGDGSGLFSNAIPVLNLAFNYAAEPFMERLLVGDYDSDDNADLAVVAYTEQESEGNINGTIVHVLYGGGDFTFDDTTLLNVSSGVAAVGSGDLNSDGYTDLFIMGIDGLQTYYGQGDRTFAAYTQQIPGWSYYDTTLPVAVNFPAMADFNDDGLMDLVVEANDYTNGGFLVFFLARPDPGQFDYQTWNLQPSGTYDSAFAVGDFNGDEAPDWVNHFYTISSGSMPTTTGLNTTANGNFSNCTYPSAARGISLCSPTSSPTSPVDFNATAHSFGQLRKMELWVDGNKLAEQHHTWGGNAFLNFSTSSLAAGPHQGTIFAGDVDHTLQRYDFNFTVGPSSCSAPSSDGVNVCSPADGSTTSSTQVLVQGAATVDGTLARMEIWVDGSKKYTETNSTSLSASISLRPGSHQITVCAVNTDGVLWDQTVTATVP
jgi:hypothetical protein